MAYYKNMFFDDDIDIFFGDFAEPCKIGSKTVNVLFDNQQTITDNGFTSVIGYKPQISIKNTDIALTGLTEDTIVVIRGKSYIVVSITDDGYGISNCMLQTN